MTAQVLSALILAAIAVLGAIGSVLMLSFRVGTLVGKVSAWQERSVADAARIWAEFAALDAKHDKHIEIFHGGYRDHR